MNNKKLLIIFVAALAVFFLAKMLTGNKASSFDPVIAAVDTAKVDRIEVHTTAPSIQSFEIRRDDNHWIASMNGKTIEVGAESIVSLLTPLMKLEAKRVVTDKESKYAEYEIEESKATHLVVWEKKKKVADFFVGGFRFDQMTRSASGFIRRSDKPEVYEVDGFLSMGLRPNFDQFRDKTILKTTPEDILALDWSNQNGNKQSLRKEENVWYYAGMEAVDSSKIATYLSALVASQGRMFSELESTQGLSILEQLSVSGNNMIAPVVLSAYASQDTLKPFLIHSTANPDALFLSDSMGLYKQIFSDLRQFWPDGQ